MDTSTTLPTLSPLLAGDAPLMLWASGRTSMRPEGRGRFSDGVGLYSEVGKYNELDEACQAAKLPRMEIRHSGGATSINWLFGEEARVCPLTTGPRLKSVFELKQRGKALANAQAGVGARWTTDFKGKPASQVAVRCLVPALLDVGFTGVVQLQLKSTMSDALLQALAEHLRIGHAAAAELGTPVTLAELELPLGAGPEKVVGKGDQTSTLTPLVAQHPKAPTREYLQSIYRPGNRGLFEQLWPSVQAWAEEFTQASTEEQATPAARPKDDLYRPQPDEMELAIAQARTQDVLEFLRSHTLDLRDKGEIGVEEQAHLSALIEDRLDDLVGGI